MRKPRAVYFFKTSMAGGTAHVKEPIKLAAEAEALLSPSRRRVLIMASGKTGAGKSTLLDI
jgi:Flp pilus assembly CpaF family ATPase